jgi:hypothetical protein
LGATIFQTWGKSTLLRLTSSQHFWDTINETTIMHCQLYLCRYTLPLLRWTHLTMRMKAMMWHSDVHLHILYLRAKS